MAQVIRLGTKTYTVTEQTFIKSEYAASERPKNVCGEPIVWKWGTQRLKNEHAALLLVAARTSIPVPEVVRLGEHANGALFLETERVYGIEASEVRNKCRAPPGHEHVAFGECTVCENDAATKVNNFIQTIVLPQLQALTSNMTGLDGFLCPPQRILEYDSRPTWESRQATSGEHFVFCHGDLSRMNIMLDERTLDVVSILDWENAGFYPKELERPVWALNDEEYTAMYHDYAKLQEEIKLITG